MKKSEKLFEKHWTKATGKPLDETTKHHMKYAIDAIDEALNQCSKKSNKTMNTDNSYNDLIFLGKKITELKRVELYKAIQWLYEDNERYRKMYFASQEAVCDFMQIAIDAKKQNCI